MNKIIIYGAGNNCRRFFSESSIYNYEVLFIVDRDPSKCGREYENTKIISPEKIIDIEYDYILIVISKWKDAFEYLNNELHIPEHKILIYDFFRKCAFDINRKIEIERKAKMASTYAESIISEKLLLECKDKGEFDGYDSIYVIGDDKWFYLIRNFFDMIGKKVNFFQYDPTCSFDLDYQGKYIITDEHYKDICNMLVLSGFVLRQILIIPLFDVKDSMRIYL